MMGLPDHLRFSAVHIAASGQTEGTDGSYRQLGIRNA